MFFKPSEEKVRKAVIGFLDESYRGEADIIDFSVKKRDVTVVLSVRHPGEKEKLRRLHDEMQSLVMSCSGVKNVNIILTAEKTVQDGRGSSAHGCSSEGAGADNPSSRPLVPEVKHIIAVASGKGGVGKSTVANNLAIALAQSGLSVGLMDADVYGPSQAHMMGVSGKKNETDGDAGDNYLIPVEQYGIRVMSMAFLVPQDKALIWRGPMVQSAVTQMLRDVKWGRLDVLIVDMPPGTGDAALTLAQKVPLAGAVIVSTPQDIALLDAVRGVEMFRAVNVPILGIIENMSIFCCPNCGHETDFFGRGGVQKKAAVLNVPYLGSLPLDAAMREAGDAGKPIVIYHPLSVHAEAFKEMAAKLRESLNI